MKIAIPTANKKLCMHFGHCETFYFFDINKEDKTISSRSELTPPPHAPGILPKWISEQGATIVLAGGIGKKAQSLFNQNGVKVIVGVVESDPERAVLDYLGDKLSTSSNVCDH